MEIAEVLDLIRINEHSSIRVGGTLGSPESLTLPTLYFDPFRIAADPHDADVILITHDHYDHYSPDDIARVARPGTHFVVPESLADAVFGLGYTRAQIHVMDPGSAAVVRDLRIQAFASYNQDKAFHPRSSNWVGYRVEYAGAVLYVAGDTDATPELAKVLPTVDIALIPVGGTFTMDAAEAAALVNRVAHGPHNPDFVVPTHYGTVTGSAEDGRSFAAALDDAWRAKVLL